MERELRRALRRLAMAAAAGLTMLAQAEAGGPAALEEGLKKLRSLPSQATQESRQAALRSFLVFLAGERDRLAASGEKAERAHRFAILAHELFFSEAEAVGFSSPEKCQAVMARLEFLGTPHAGDMSELPPQAREALAFVEGACKRHP
jgi:hypothetical protein